MNNKDDNKKNDNKKKEFAAFYNLKKESGWSMIATTLRLYVERFFMELRKGTLVPQKDCQIDFNKTIKELSVIDATMEKLASPATIKELSDFLEEVFEMNKDWLQSMTVELSNMQFVEKQEKNDKQKTNHKELGKAKKRLN